MGNNTNLGLKITIGLLCMGLFFSCTRQVGLEGRLKIIEVSLAKAPPVPVSSALPRQEADLVRAVCRSLRGSLAQTGSEVFCQLPAAQSTITKDFRSKVSSTDPSQGGGIEVHYANRSARQCIELTGAAKCDPMTKAVTCPNGVRLIRVAPTTDDKGIRNRYVCGRG